MFFVARPVPFESGENIPELWGNGIPSGFDSRRAHKKAIKN